MEQCVLRQRIAANVSPDNCYTLNLSSNPYLTEMDIYNEIRSHIEDEQFLLPDDIVDEISEKLEIEKDKAAIIMFCSYNILHFKLSEIFDEDLILQSSCEILLNIIENDSNFVEEYFLSKLESLTNEEAEYLIMANDPMSYLY